MCYEYNMQKFSLSCRIGRELFIFFTKMNKCLYFMVLVLATAASLQITTQNKLERGLLKIIEKWKKGNVRTIPIALPTLPLKQAPIKFEYDGFILSVSESIIWGLENLSVQRLTASTSNLTTSITFDVPVVAGLSDWYRFQGWFIFRIDNQGEFSLTVTTLQVTIRLEFAPQGPNTVIQKLDLDFSVGAVEVNLSGCNFFVLMEINNKIRGLVSQKNEFVIGEIKKQVINTTNSILQGYTPKQLIKLFSSVI